MALHRQAVPFGEEAALVRHVSGEFYSQRPGIDGVVIQHESLTHDHGQYVVKWHPR
jgi:hypothetical protein